jgi:hypothetical protein
MVIVRGVFVGTWSNRNAQGVPPEAFSALGGVTCVVTVTPPQTAFVALNLGSTVVPQTNKPPYPLTMAWFGKSITNAPRTTVDMCSEALPTMAHGADLRPQWQATSLLGRRNPRKPRHPPPLRIRKVRLELIGNTPEGLGLGLADTPDRYRTRYWLLRQAKCPKPSNLPILTDESLALVLGYQSGLTVSF